MNIHQLLELPVINHGDAWLHLINYEFIEELKLGYSYLELDLSKLFDIDLKYELVLTSNEPYNFDDDKYASEVYIVRYNGVPLFMVYRYGKYQQYVEVYVLDKVLYDEFKGLLDLAVKEKSTYFPKAIINRDFDINVIVNKAHTLVSNE